MKATIKKEISLSGETNYFKVYSDGFIIQCYAFKPDAPEGDSYNEVTNLEKALILAKKIEAGITCEETVIYETGVSLPLA